MFIMFKFLACWSLLHVPLQTEAVVFHFGSAASSFQYSNFVEHKALYLKVPRQLITSVHEFDDCAMNCVISSPACLSVNVASEPDGKGMFWCELLLADMYNNSQSLKENSTSHHFSKWTPCLNKPCINGGYCVPFYKDDSFKCVNCSAGFTGNRCETNIDDCASSPCVNGGTCTDGVNGFTCTCAAGFHGETCNITGGGNIWTGAKEVGNVWIWEDGKPWGDYTAWGPGEPNSGNLNHCLQMYKSNCNWNDHGCSNKLSSVCKIGCNLNDGWKKFNSHCYKFVQTRKNWSSAKNYCNGLSSYLVTIHSQAEKDFVGSLTPNDGIKTWLGLSDIASEGAWIWEDGKPWGSYTAWVSGEPNDQYGEDCVEIYETSNLWNDRRCSVLNSFVCKSEEGNFQLINGER